MRARKVARKRRGASPVPQGEIYSLSEEETFRFGETLGRSLSGGEMILLIGELGSGKTVFARGIASGLGIAPSEVGSPTFIIVDRHEGRSTLYHADLYRLDREEDILDLNLDEYAATGAVVVVEWGERLPSSLGAGALRVRITDLGDDSRRIEIRR